MASRSEKPGADGSAGTNGAQAIARTIADALEHGSYDVQQSGELFVHQDAERAIRDALGENARIAVRSRGDAGMRSTSFMGARFAPDLLVETGSVAIPVTVTLLSGNAAPIPGALANALVLSGRYPAVVAFVLDRRLAKRNPFADPGEESAAPSITDAERGFLDQLWRAHHVLVRVRRQDPFGWS